MEFSKEEQIKTINIAHQELDETEQDKTKDLTLTPTMAIKHSEFSNIFASPTLRKEIVSAKQPRRTVAATASQKLTENPNKLKKRKTSILELNIDKLNPVKTPKDSIIGEDLPGDENHSPFNGSKEKGDTINSPQSKEQILRLYTYVKGDEAKEYFEELSKREKDPGNEKLVITEENKVSLSVPAKRTLQQRNSFFIPEARRQTDTGVQEQIKGQRLTFMQKVKRYILCCCYKQENERNMSLLRTSALSFPLSARNRFAHLEGREKSIEIRAFFRNSVHKLTFLMKTINIFKLMGNKSMNQNTAREISPKCLIMPGSKFRILWDMLSVIQLLYISIMTPFTVAYLDDIPAGISYIETIICVLFFVDIIFNFFTPYLEHNKLIISHRQIAKKYLKTWFFLDLIASIPFHLIIADENNTVNPGWTSLPRMLTMLKLFKLGRLLQFIQLFMDKIALRYKIKPDSTRRMRYCVSVLFVVHIFSCAWYLQARLGGFSPECWVLRYSYYDHGIYYKYFLSCFWVCQTLTTVVYGDYQPSTFSERFLCFILMIFGVIFYSSLFANMSEKEKTLRYKILTLANLASQTRLPPELMAKIRNNIEFKYDNEDGPQMKLYEQLLEDLSSGLRAELVKYIYGNVIKKIRFFIDKPPEFLFRIIPKLKHVIYNKGEIIYKPKETANEIYFIKEGMVLLETDSSKKITSFAKGSYFGDTEIIKSDISGTCCDRVTYAIAQEHSELYVINKTKFFGALSEFPDVEDYIYTTYKIRELRQRQIEEGCFNETFVYADTDEPKRKLQVPSSFKVKQKYIPQQYFQCSVGENDSSESESDLSNSATSSSDNSSSYCSTISKEEVHKDKSISVKTYSKKDLDKLKYNSAIRLSEYNDDAEFPNYNGTLPDPSVIPQQKNEQVGREANLNNNYNYIPHKSSSQDKIYVPSLEQNNEREEMKNDTNLNTSMKIINRFPLTESICNPTYLKNFTFESEVIYMENSLRGKEEVFHENERMGLTQSICSSNQSSPHLPVTCPPMTKGNEAFSDEVRIMKQNFIVHKENDANIEEKEIGNIDQEVNTHRKLLEKHSSGIKSHRQVQSSTKVENQINRQETRRKSSKKYNKNLDIHSKRRKTKKSICVGRDKKLRKNSSQLLNPNEIIPDNEYTNKLSSTTRKQKTMKDSLVTGGKIIRTKTMRNIELLQRKSNANNQNQIIIAINLNSQNKSIRVFMKDLKLDLIKVVEGVFSAALDKFEEAQALFIMK